MIQWEYKSRIISPFVSRIQVLREEGLDGWEAWSTYKTEIISNGIGADQLVDAVAILFKRPYLFALDDQFSTLNSRLNSLEARLSQLISQQGVVMTQELSTLQSEVAETLSVQQSAIVLIQGLAAKIVELKDDPAALQALADSLDASSNALSAAVVANTPAQPPVDPPVNPPVEETPA